MSEQVFKLTNHPAMFQRRDVVTGEKLGAPTPLFPHQRAVRMNGKIIGYVDEQRRVSLIVPRNRLAAGDMDEIKRIVEEELGSVTSLQAVAERVEVAFDDDDDDLELE